MERFLAGCRFMGLAAPEVTAEQLVELANVNGLAEARGRVRLMAFADEQPYAGGKVRHIAALWPAPAIGILPNFKCTVSATRRAPGDVSFQFKLTGRAEVFADLENATAHGYQDVLYFNDDDAACEAAYSNLWVLKGDTLITPPVEAPCLPGIVRNHLLDTAEGLGLDAAEQVIRRADIAQADAIFLTSSIRRIQPVAMIEGLWHLEPERMREETVARLAISLSG